MLSQVRCAYCTGFVPVNLSGFRYPGRSTICDTLQCPACSSTFRVELKTLRVKAGKGFRAILKAQRDALLAEPGCTCGDRMSRHTPRHYWNCPAHKTG